MLVLWIVLILLALLLLMNVGAEGAWSQGAGRISIRVGPVQVFRRDFPGEAAGEEAKGVAEEKPEKKLPDFVAVRPLIPMALHALGRLRRRVKVDFLQLHFIAGSPDPYQTAMHYGAASAAVGTFFPALEQAVTIERRDIEIQADFDAAEAVFAGQLSASVPVWALLYITLAFGAEFIKWKLQQRRKSGAEERTVGNGASNRRTDERDNGQNPGNGGREHRGGHACHNS